MLLGNVMLIHEDKKLFIFHTAHITRPRTNDPVVIFQDGGELSEWRPDPSRRGHHRSGSKPKLKLWESHG